MAHSDLNHDHDSEDGGEVQRAEIFRRPVDRKERRSQSELVCWLGVKGKEKTEEGREENPDC